MYILGHFYKDLTFLADIVFFHDKKLGTLRVSGATPVVGGGSTLGEAGPGARVSVRLTRLDIMSQKFPTIPSTLSNAL